MTTKWYDKIVTLNEAGFKAKKTGKNEGNNQARDKSRIDVGTWS
jgi:hypothetical protein